jgi:hypothetical protein
VRETASTALAGVKPLFGRLFDGHNYAGAFWIATAIPLCGFAEWMALGRARAAQS